MVTTIVDSSDFDISRHHEMAAMFPTILTLHRLPEVNQVSRSAKAWTQGIKQKKRVRTSPKLPVVHCCFHQ
jgi:hypothetical protein